MMGVQWPYDPDDSYELTTDNLKKILAIHMRFRLVKSFKMRQEKCVSNFILE